MGIVATARLFGIIHTAMTDAMINCWRLKRDVGFWRPFQAISGEYDDGNPATTPEPGWTPLRPKPNYSDYVSGHACLTGPSVQVIRRFLGEPSRWRSARSTSRTSRGPTRMLSELEFDAFHARIWGGFHYRKAMTDGYDIAHRTADAVMGRFSC